MRPQPESQIIREHDYLRIYLLSGTRGWCPAYKMTPAMQAERKLAIVPAIMAFSPSADKS